VVEEAEKGGGVPIADLDNVRFVITTEVVQLRGRDKFECKEATVTVPTIPGVGGEPYW
jgi:hypothetical protein